jgi:hypothetical protein
MRCVPQFVSSCLRQAVSTEDYTPSLRNASPRSPGHPHRFYSRKVRRLSECE